MRKSLNLEDMHEQLKVQGNELFAQGKFTEAIELYIAYVPGVKPPQNKHFTDCGCLASWPAREVPFDPTEFASYRGLYGGAKVPSQPGNVLVMNGQGVSDLVLDDKLHFSRLLDEVAPAARPIAFRVAKKLPGLS